jgi:hypothetical protein
VARSHTQVNPNKTTKTLVTSLALIGARNKAEDRALKKMIIEYSAIKIKVKPMAPYSTLKPETSSDSPSEKSKGVRLVSATQDTNQKKNRKGEIEIIKKCADAKLTPKSVIDPL